MTIRCFRSSDLGIRWSSAPNPAATSRGFWPRRRRRSSILYVAESPNRLNHHYQLAVDSGDAPTLDSLPNRTRSFSIDKKLVEDARHNDSPMSLW